MESGPCFVYVLIVVLFFLTTGLFPELSLFSIFYLCACAFESTSLPCLLAMLRCYQAIMKIVSQYVHVFQGILNFHCTTNMCDVALSRYLTDLGAHRFF